MTTKKLSSSTEPIAINSALSFKCKSVQISLPHKGCSRQQTFWNKGPVRRNWQASMDYNSETHTDFSVTVTSNWGDHQLRDLTWNVKIPRNNFCWHSIKIALCTVIISTDYCNCQLFSQSTVFQTSLWCTLCEPSRADVLSSNWCLGSLF
jgi:hypothetical protein